MQNLLLDTIIVGFIQLMVFMNYPLHAYMKGMLREELVVSNQKIRLKPSRKLIIRPLAKNAEVYVAVRGEVDPNITEVFLNGVKAQMVGQNFLIEYSVREPVHESRVYAHDDPKNPNYAVVKFKIEKLEEMKKFATDFFGDLAAKMPKDLIANREIVEYFLEFRQVEKSNFYEPFIVFILNNNQKRQWKGNFTEKELLQNQTMKLAWPLDESGMNLRLAKGIAVLALDVRKLYPGGILPWELTNIEHELGPSLPKGLYPEKKSDNKELKNKEIKNEEASPEPALINPL